MEGRLDKMDEWLKALAFLWSISKKDEYFNFARSFVVLLNQERISEGVGYLALWRRAVHV
jgi:hypothetical protein